LSKAMAKEAARGREFADHKHNINRHDAQTARHSTTFLRITNKTLSGPKDCAE
jgi:hypothetical protein